MDKHTFRGLNIMTEYYRFSVRIFAAENDQTSALVSQYMQRYSPFSGSVSTKT